MLLEHLASNQILSCKEIAEALITGNALALGASNHFKPAVWQIRFCNQRLCETEKINLLPLADLFNLID